MKHYKKFFPGIYVFSFAAIGALFPLIAQYLYAIGFSGTQIGIVTSSSTAIGIISNSFWGGVYHRRKRSKKLIVFLSVATALLSLFLMVAGQFWLFLALYVLVFFFENPIYPLVDSTVIEVNYPFGAARKWGAVGFAVGIGIAGFVADRFGLLSIFPMFAAFFILTAVLVWLYSNVQSRLGQGEDSSAPGFNGTRKSGEKESVDKTPEDMGSYKDLLGNKKYMLLLISAFFFNGPSLSHNTYFSFLYLDVGGTIAGMGLVLLLMVISEAPVMAFSERIASVLTTERAVLLAMSVSALRFLWYSTNPGPELIAATFMLQGIANGIAIVEIMKYVAQLVEPYMLSLAIPLFTAISLNSGTITCQFFGGIIVESYGGHGVYLFYGLLNIIGVLIYIISGLHRPTKV